MSLNYSFAGKSIFITGGSNGIGRQLVKRFHDGGAKVFTVGKNAERVQKLREDFAGVTAEIVDLADWDATRKVVEGFGPVDYLVNNAAAVEMSSIMELTKELISLHFDVNVGAVVNVTQVVAKQMIESGREGSIVNIGSIDARFGSTSGIAIYSSSKAAVENLTKSMALELGAHKIRVNCVLPGCVDTDLLHKFIEGPEMIPEAKKQIEDGMRDRVIIKRLAEPNEIADAVMFLLSPLSSMITGEGLAVDGGWLAT